MRDQRDGKAFGAGAAGAADAVHVVLGDHRQVEVDHERQLVDVDSACGDVGRNKNGNFPVLEIGERARARVLALVAVDRCGAQAVLVEEFDQLVGAVLGAAEHQRLAAAVAAEQFEQQVALLRRVDRMHAMRDRRDDAVARGNLHFGRIAHELARERLDLIGERGREQQRLAILLRQRVEDALHLRQEAHVEHAVGLVENEDLDARDVGRAPFEMIDQAARRGDDDVDAAAQRVDLRLHADAAEDRRGEHAQMLGVGADVLVNLRGELARRREDEHARAALAAHGSRIGKQAL